MPDAYRDLLAAIAYGDDPSITAHDRMAAARELRQLERMQRDVVAELVADVMEMSEEELDQSLRDYFAEPPPRPQIDPAELDRRVDARIRAKIARGELVEVTDQPERGDAGAARRALPEPATEDDAAEVIDLSTHPWRRGEPVHPRRGLTGGRGPQGQGI